MILSENVIGQKFNKLEIIAYIPINERRHKNNVWLCKCDCGNITQAILSNLKRGRHQSCGCTREAFYKISRKGNKGSMWHGYEELPLTYFNLVKKRALISKLEFNLTIEFLWQLFLDQDRKCALTDMPLTFSRESISSGGNASLDRIDNDGDYTEDNVQWLHKDVNFMKQDFDQEYFIECCRLIVNKQQSVSRDSAIESREA